MAFGGSADWETADPSNINPGDKYIFQPTSSYSYSFSCVVGAEVIVQNHRAGSNPPVNVKWPASGFTYYVHYKDLKVIEDEQKDGNMDSEAVQKLEKVAAEAYAAFKRVGVTETPVCELAELVIQKVRGSLPEPAEDATSKKKKKKKKKKTKDKSKASRRLWESIVPDLLIRENCTPMMKVQHLQQHAIGVRSGVFKSFAETDRDRLDDWEPSMVSEAIVPSPETKVAALGLMACTDVLADACDADSSVVMGQATLSALQGMLQPIKVAGLAWETRDFVEQLEHTLVAIVQDGREEFVSLASSCLASLALSRGSASALLRAVKVLLSSRSAFDTKRFRIPQAILDLEAYAKDIAFPGEAMDWMSALLSGKSELEALKLPTSDDGPCLFAAAGGYLYLQTGKVLRKIGTGYRNTTRGAVVASSTLSPNDGEASWLGFVCGSLYRRLATDSPGTLTVLDSSSLEAVRVVHQQDVGHGTLDGTAPYVLVAMAHGLGCIEASPDAQWKFRTFVPAADGNMACVREVAVAPSTRYTISSGKIGWNAGAASGDRLDLPKNVAKLVTSETFAVAVTTTGSVFFRGSCSDFKSTAKWLLVAVPVGAVIVDALIPTGAKYALLIGKDGRLYGFGQSYRTSGIGKAESPRLELYSTQGKYKTVMHDMGNGNVVLMNSGERMMTLMSAEPEHARLVAKRGGGAENGAAEDPAMNLSGFMAEVKGDGKYYCGKAMDDSCVCGSCSICAPDSKCRCRSCEALNATSSLGGSRVEAKVYIEGHDHPLVKWSHAKSLLRQPPPKVLVCSLCKERVKTDAWMSCVDGPSLVACKACVTKKLRFDMTARATGFCVPVGHTVEKSSGCGVHLLAATSDGKLLRSTSAAVPPISEDDDSSPMASPAAAAAAAPADDSEASSADATPSTQEAKKGALPESGDQMPGAKEVGKALGTGTKRLFNKCPAEKHIWTSNGARLCSTCRQCTAYGKACPVKGGILSTFGSWGCALCGTCRRCGGHQDSKKGKKANDKKLSDMSAWRGQVYALAVVDDVDGVQDIQSGALHSLVLLKSGVVLAMGSNSFGQLGVGDVDSRVDLCAVKLPDGAVAVQIATGRWHSLVRTTDGKVYTFGRNDNGQLARDVPIQDHTPGVVDVGDGAVLGMSADVSCSYFTFAEEVANESMLASCSALHADNQLLLLPSRGQKLLSVDLFDGTFAADNTQDNLHDTVLAADFDCGICWSFNPANGVATVHCAEMPKAQSASDLNAATHTRILQTTLSPAVRLPLGGALTVSPANAAASLLTNLHTIIHGALGSVGLEEFELNQNAISHDDYNECVRFAHMNDNNWGYSGAHAVDAVAFKVDQPVSVGGFGIFSSTSISKPWDCEASIYEGSHSPGKLLARIKTKMEKPPAARPGSNLTYCKVWFDEPVSIEENKQYSAVIRLSNPVSHQQSSRGSSGKSEVNTPAGVKFNFMSSGFSKNGTDVNSGQIPAILFYPGGGATSAATSSKVAMPPSALQVSVVSCANDKRIVINGRTTQAPPQAGCLVSAVDPRAQHRVLTKAFPPGDTASVAKFVQDIPDGHVVCYAGSSLESTAPEIQDSLTPPANTSAIADRLGPTFQEEDHACTRAFVLFKGGVVLSDEVGKSPTDMVELQHKITGESLTRDDEDVSLDRVFRFVSPDALQSLLGLIQWVKRALVDANDGVVASNRESLNIIAASSMRLAKGQILSFFRKDVYGLHTNFCQELPPDVSDVILAFRDLLLRVIESPALMHSVAIHDEALGCFFDCWEIFYPTRELRLRLLYSLLFATAASGTASEEVRQGLLGATLKRLAARAGMFLGLFPEKREDKVVEVRPVTVIPVSGDDAFEAIHASTSQRSVKNLASPDNAGSYWESDGPSGTHWICIEMMKDVFVEEIELVPHTPRDSYRPSMLTISVGGHDTDIQDKDAFTTLHQVNCSSIQGGQADKYRCLDECSEYYRYVRIGISAVGMNTKIRGVRVKGTRRDGQAAISEEAEILSPFAKYVGEKEEPEDSEMDVGIDAFEPVLEKLLDIITAIKDSASDDVNDINPAARAALDLLSTVNASFAMEKTEFNRFHIVVLKSVLRRVQEAMQYEGAYEAGSMLDRAFHETIAHAHYVAATSRSFCEEISDLVANSFVALASEKRQHPAILCETDDYKATISCKPMTRSIDLYRQAVEFGPDVDFMYVKFERGVRIKEGCKIVMLVNASKSNSGPERRYAKFSPDDDLSDLLLVPGNRLVVEYRVFLNGDPEDGREPLTFPKIFVGVSNGVNRTLSARDEVERQLAVLGAQCSTELLKSRGVMTEILGAPIEVLDWIRYSNLFRGGILPVDSKPEVLLVEQRKFLDDFVDLKPGSSGRALAQWLQGTTFVEPSACTVSGAVPTDVPVQIGKTHTLVLVTKSFDGTPVAVSDDRIKVTIESDSKSSDGKSGEQYAAELVYDEAKLAKTNDFSKNGQPRQNKIIANIAATVGCMLSPEELRFMQTRKVSTKVDVSPAKPGVHLVKWVGKSAGDVLVNIYLDGSHVAGSPFAYKLEGVEDSVKEEGTAGGDSVDGAPAVAQPAAAAAPAQAASSDSTPSVRMAGTSGMVVCLENDLPIRAGMSKDALDLGKIPKNSEITISGEAVQTEEGFWCNVVQPSISNYVDEAMRHLPAYIMQCQAEWCGGGVFLSELDGTPMPDYETAATAAAAVEEEAAEEKSLKVAPLVKDSVSDSLPVIRKESGPAEVDVNLDDYPDAKIFEKYPAGTAKALRKSFSVNLWHSNCVVDTMAVASTLQSDDATEPTRDFTTADAVLRAIACQEFVETKEPENLHQGGLVCYQSVKYGLGIGKIKSCAPMISSAKICDLRVGMMLEVENKIKGTFEVALVQRLTSTADGLTVKISLVGRPDNTNFECKMDADKLYPVGYSSLAGLALHNPPRLQNGQPFRWDRYLHEKSALPVPMSCFASDHHDEILSKLVQTGDVSGDTFVSPVFGQALKPTSSVTKLSGKPWPCNCCGKTFGFLPEAANGEGTKRDGVDLQSWTFKGGQWHREGGHPRLAPDTTFRYMVGGDDQVCERCANRVCGREFQVQTGVIIERDDTVMKLDTDDHERRIRVPAKHVRLVPESVESPSALGGGAAQAQVKCDVLSRAWYDAEKLLLPLVGVQTIEAVDEQSEAPPTEPPGVNSDGAEVTLSTQPGMAHLYYCNRHLGRSAIPGSDGRCGPSNGPQCKSCKEYQAAWGSDPAKGLGFGQAKPLGNQNNQAAFGGGGGGGLPFGGKGFGSGFGGGGGGFGGGGGGFGAAAGGGGFGAAAGGGGFGGLFGAPAVQFGAPKVPFPGGPPASAAATTDVSEPSREAEVTVGMRLEAKDRKNPRLVCVANIKSIKSRSANGMADKVVINFDGWSDTYDYSARLSDEDLHPVGWCSKTGHKLEAPKSYGKAFDWGTYLAEKALLPVPANALSHVVNKDFHKEEKLVADAESVPTHNEWAAKCDALMSLAPCCPPASLSAPLSGSTISLVWLFMRCTTPAHTFLSALQSGSRSAQLRLRGLRELSQMMPCLSTATRHDVLWRMLPLSTVHRGVNAGHDVRSAIADHHHDFLGTITKELASASAGDASLPLLTQCWLSATSADDLDLMQQTGIIDVVTKHLEAASQSTPNEETIVADLAAADDVAAAPAPADGTGAVPSGDGVTSLDYPDLTADVILDGSSGPKSKTEHLRDGLSGSFWECTTGKENANFLQIKQNPDVKRNQAVGDVAVFFDNSDGTICSAVSLLHELKGTQLSKFAVGKSHCGWVTLPAAQNKQAEGSSDERDVYLRLHSSASGNKPVFRLRQIKILGKPQPAPADIPSNVAIASAVNRSALEDTFRFLIDAVFKEMADSDKEVPMSAQVMLWKVLCEGTSDVIVHQRTAVFTRIMQQLESLSRTMSAPQQGLRVDHVGESLLPKLVGKFCGVRRLPVVDVAANADTTAAVVRQIGFSSCGSLLWAAYCEGELVSDFDGGVPEVAASTIDAHLLRMVQISLATEAGLDTVKGWPMFLDQLVSFVCVGSLEARSIALATVETVMKTSSPSDLSGLMKKSPVSEVDSALIGQLLVLLMRAMTLDDQGAPEDVPEDVRMVSFAETSFSAIHMPHKAIDAQTANRVLELLRNMSSGEYGEAWKVALQEASWAILTTSMGRVDAGESAHSLTLWSVAACLICIDDAVIAHVDSSMSARKENADKLKFCMNHDDGITSSAVRCEQCEKAFCAHCDRVLHRPQCKRHHTRMPLDDVDVSIGRSGSKTFIKTKAASITVDSSSFMGVYETLSPPAAKDAPSPAAAAAAAP